jgi:Protein of unknown function (DUF1501)
VIGLNDLPVGSSANRPAGQYQISVQSGTMDVSALPDLRMLVGPETTINYLASTMAVTEYVLLNNLSKSIAFAMGDATNLVAPGGGIFSPTNDQHYTGLFPTTFLTPLRHRACMACIAELKHQLVMAGKFNDTVIMMSGEFNRNPRLDMSGSDHGSTGTNHTLYCGAFDGPLIIGNLTNDAELSWGKGGVVPELGRNLNMTDSMITLAHLLRVPSPLSSSGPLVTLSERGLVSNIGTTRYV